MSVFTDLDPESSIALQGAGALVRQIATGVLSSRDLLEIYLDRIQRLNPSLNAVVTTETDAARRQADAADAAVRDGHRLGSLHGLPMIVKDTLETAGMRTTSGAPSRAAAHSDRDAKLSPLRRAAPSSSARPTPRPTPPTRRPPTGLGPPTIRGAGTLAGGFLRRFGRGEVAAGLFPDSTGRELSGSAGSPAHYCGYRAAPETAGPHARTSRLRRLVAQQRTW